MKLKNLTKRLSRLQPSQWTWMIACLLAGFLAYYRDATTSPVTGVHEPESIESAATFIPAGYVLVPIEIANYESLDSILGKFGVVDLYIPSDDPTKKAKKVAERLRILRAPLNPSRFAVLAKEEDSPRLVTHDGAFTVVVKNPNHTGTEIVRGDIRNDGKNDPENAAIKKKRGVAKRPPRITVEVMSEDKN